MNIIIPNGFEANYTLGFCKGISDNRIPIKVASCPATHSRLRKEGIACEKLMRGRKLPGALSLLEYYIALTGFLYKNRRQNMHFIGVFRNNRVIIEGFAICLLCRIFSRRFIYTVHNLLPHGKDDSRFFFIIYWLIYRLPNSLLVHTKKGQSQLIRKFGISSSKIATTSIGVNEEVAVTSLSQAEARRRLKLSPESKCILCFGKVEPYKGVDTMIETLEKLHIDNVKLIIAGAFTSKAFEREILERIASSPCKNKILLHNDHIPNEDVETYFKACDVLTLPYRNIYQSGVLFLSLNFGIPIVANDVGSLKEYVTADVGVISQSNNSDGLTNAFHAFFDSSRKYNRKSIQAYARNFTWRNCCKKIRTLYRSQADSIHPQAI